VREPDEFEALRRRIDGVGRESHDKIARLEALVDDLGRRLAQAETALASLPSPGETTVTTQSPNGSGEPQAEPSVAPVSTTETMLVQRSGDYKLEILGLRSNRHDVIVDLAVTRERGGDGYVEVLAPRSGARGTRIVTADGRELGRGGVGLYNKNRGTTSRDADVVEGVPMRFTIAFDYRGERPKRCARLQILAYSKRERQGKMMFRFDDVLIE